jgi:ribosomal protein S8
MALFLFFVNLKCAHKNKQRYFYLKPTKQILELVSLFYKTGYISGFCLLKHRSSRNLVLKITLKHTIGSHGPIDKLCTFSSSTSQKFITYKHLWLTNSHGGVIFLSTPFGYLTLSDAKKLNTGGELLLFIA